MFIAPLITFLSSCFLLQLTEQYLGFHTNKKCTEQKNTLYFLKLLSWVFKENGEQTTKPRPWFMKALLSQDVTSHHVRAQIWSRFPITSWKLKKTLRNTVTVKEREIRFAAG